MPDTAKQPDRASLPVRLALVGKKALLPCARDKPDTAAGPATGRRGAHHDDNLLLVPYAPHRPAACNLPEAGRCLYVLERAQTGTGQAGKGTDGKGLPATGKFIIYAPSLTGILAHAILAGVPGTKGLLLDKAWAGSKMRLAWLAIRLRYERLRLGSDVESPYLHRLAHREKLQSVLPPLSIGHWLSAVEQMRAFPLPGRDFVLWRDKAQIVEADAWAAMRFAQNSSPGKNTVQ